MSESARFPISGPMEVPTAADYSLEAALLRQEAAAFARRAYHALWHQTSTPATESARLYDLHAPLNVLPVVNPTPNG